MKKNIAIVLLALAGLVSMYQKSVQPTLYSTAGPAAPVELKAVEKENLLQNEKGW